MARPSCSIMYSGLLLIRLVVGLWWANRFIAVLVSTLVTYSLRLLSGLIVASIPLIYLYIMMVPVLQVSIGVFFTSKEVLMTSSRPNQTFVLIRQNSWLENSPHDRIFSDNYHLGFMVRRKSTSTLSSVRTKLCLDSSQKLQPCQCWDACNK